MEPRLGGQQKIFIFCSRTGRGSHQSRSRTRPRVSLTRPRVSLTGPGVSLTWPRVSLTRPRASLTRPRVSLTRGRVTLTRPRVSLTRGRVGLILPSHPLPSPPSAPVHPIPSSSPPLAENLSYKIATPPRQAFRQGRPIPIPRGSPHCSSEICDTTYSHCFISYVASLPSSPKGDDLG